MQLIIYNPFMRKCISNIWSIHTEQQLITPNVFRGSINRIIKPAGVGMYIYADVSPIWLNLDPYDKGVGYKDMSPILAGHWPIVPSYMSPNEGGGRGGAGSQPMNTAVHMQPNYTLEIELNI
jgi:hypothetical protein